MIALRLSEVAEAVGGRVVAPQGSATPGGPPEDVVVDGAVVVDSRMAGPGSLFVAVAGERVDGHDFAATARDAGAVAALGSRPTELPTVVVPDVVEALGALASEVLRRVRSGGDLEVVALTGSQGKTSTKDLLAAVLARRGEVVATAGNFNNEVGVPLTALRVTPSTRTLVLEMGARGVGHLTYLCSVARPDVSVVLNVGKAHLGEFGTQADIAQAKGELVEALEPSGTAVLNADDPLVSAMASRTRAHVLRVGRAADADVRLEDLRVDDRGRAAFTLRHGGRSAPVALAVVGEHQAANAAAVAGTALVLGMQLDDVAAGLSAARIGSRWRMEVTEAPGGVTVVNDAYNANPDSMRAALTSLVAIAGGARRTVAVLGEMRELGAAAEEEHAVVGRLAADLGVDRLVVVGAAAAGIASGAAERGAQVEQVDDAAAAAQWVGRNVTAGDVVLVKASRAAALETVADALAAAGGQDGHAEREEGGQA